MRLQEIKLVNFRKHADLTFSPSDGINLVYGPNGSGKTNILDAVHYCTLARGFNRSLDRECLNFAADYFLLKGRFTDDREIEISVRVSYARTSEKKISVNGEELKKFSQLIGRVPCITFSPMELAVINGSPQERRRFMDNALSQTDKRYLDDLLQYKRVLQQRNALLAAVRDNGMERGSLDAWTEKLSLLAGSIMSARTAFLLRLLEFFKPVYAELGLGEVPGIGYCSSVGVHTPEISAERLAEVLVQRLRDVEEQELYRKQTLFGPHRDDIMFRLNDVDVKKYASQGQLRTFLIAMKLALQRFVYEVTGEKPLFLLDDLFSELDRKRGDRVLELLGGSGQSIITATGKKDVKGGHCISVEELAQSVV